MFEMFLLRSKSLCCDSDNSWSWDPLFQTKKERKKKHEWIRKWQTWRMWIKTYKELFGVGEWWIPFAFGFGVPFAIGIGDDSVLGGNCKEKKKKKSWKK